MRPSVRRFAESLGLRWSGAERARKRSCSSKEAAALRSVTLGGCSLGAAWLTWPRHRGGLRAADPGRSRRCDTRPTLLSSAHRWTHSHAPSPVDRCLRVLCPAALRCAGFLFSAPPCLAARRRRASARWLWPAWPSPPPSSSHSCPPSRPHSSVPTSTPRPPPPSPSSTTPSRTRRCQGEHSSSTARSPISPSTILGQIGRHNNGLQEDRAVLLTPLTYSLPA
jgi:hypothetical protein